MMKDGIEIYSEVLVLLIFTFIHCHWCARRHSVLIIPQSFLSIWIEFHILLRLVGKMNLIHVYFVHLIFKEQKPTHKTS